MNTPKPTKDGETPRTDAELRAIDERSQRQEFADWADKSDFEFNELKKYARKLEQELQQAHQQEEKLRYELQQAQEKAQWYIERFTENEKLIFKQSTELQQARKELADANEKIKWLGLTHNL